VGFAFATGTCLGCNRLFTFNPVRVPSLGGHPICRECIEIVNKERPRRGLPPWPVPADAYEAVEESEL
jgi:hypothetical protein